MTSKLTLKPVQYYDIADVYSYEVDNRPLYDISENVDRLNTAIANVGFYHEVYANPDTEPVGGFTPLTCAYLGQNGRIYPIDISQSVVTIDYTKYPIYLVLESLGLSQYKCLAFSASFSMQSLFNKFLPTSVGSAIKLGPGGTLVDEIYFDLYYSDYGYQNLIVGKILTPTVIAFGGNQVSVIGDNRFLAKNKDDSTTGLITRYIQNDINSTAIKTELINSDNSQYTFTEYLNYVSTPYGVSETKSPIYFTSAPLVIKDGSFTASNLESVLNEVHFASPGISADTLTDIKYKTAGINVGGLINYSQNYLIHGKKLSSNLEELSQSIGTSLYFDSINSTEGLVAQFDSAYANFGTTDTTLLSSVISASTNASGVSFGNYKSGTGGIICNFTNNSPSNTEYVENLNTFDMSTLSSGNALLVYNKGDAGALILGASGPVLLTSDVGVYYKPVPTKNYEIANKLYVDMVGTSSANSAATKIPLAGTTKDAPATGGIYFDTKSNVDPNTVFQFDTLLRTDIKSTYPVEFKTLDNSAYQVLRVDTPETGNINDAVNRTFLANAFSNFLLNEFGDNYIKSRVDSTISAVKTFDNLSQIITQASVPLVLNKDITDTSTTEVFIETDSSAIHFVGPTGMDTAKLKSAQTVSTDSNDTLVTKKFVDDQIEANKPMGSIFSIWDAKAPTSKTYLTNYLGWYYGTRGVYGEEIADNFSKYFELTEDGALHYVGTETMLLNVSLICTNTGVTADGRSVQLSTSRAGSMSAVIAVKSASDGAIKVKYQAVNHSSTVTTTK